MKEEESFYQMIIVPFNRNKEVFKSLSEEASFIQQTKIT